MFMKVLSCHVLHVGLVAPAVRTSHLVRVRHCAVGIVGVVNSTGSI
jgi:hypothetical protein